MMCAIVRPQRQPTLQTPRGQLQHTVIEIEEAMEA